MSTLRTAAVLFMLGVGLSGCVQAGTLNPDFGEAYQQHVVGQIAEPDARYVGKPDPGSDGSRVGLAQKRYRTGTVIIPVPATASDIGVTAGGAQPSAGPQPQ
jgi:hypothetical protein